MNILEAAQREGIILSGGDYENYIMAYDNEANATDIKKIGLEYGMRNFYYGFEEGGFNGGTYVAYKDKDRLPLYIKEAVESERLGSSVTDMLAYFSSNLLLVKEGGAYYVMDKYYLGDSDNDYGVFEKFGKDELKDGVTASVIPDTYIDGVIDFYFFDELENQYGVDGDSRAEFETHQFHLWADIARELGYEKLYRDLKDPCRFMEGVKTRKLSDAEIAKIPEADGKIKDAIGKYEKEAAKETEEPER